MRCGIILAGGTGSRLFPITIGVNKQLLPVYDKPLIYYPLSTVMMAGIRDILIICGSEFSKKLFEKLLGDGSKFGINLTYEIQQKPSGIAEAFIIGEKFINNRPVMLALGDNIFHSYELKKHLLSFKDNSDCGIFGCQVKNPKAYGVAVLDKSGYITDIEEKPQIPQSNWAIPGLYFYNSTIIDKAKKLKPSARGELEITDLSKMYIDPNNNRQLNFIKLYDTVWFDCGTYDSLLEAAHFVQAIQARTGEMIGDPKTIALENGWIK